MSPRSTTKPEVGEASPAPEAGITRRNVLTASALLGGGLLTGKTAWAIGPGRPDYSEKGTLFQREYPLNEPENIVFSTCLGCHAACPVRVSREDGVLAKLDGSPFSTRNWRGVRPTNRQEASKMRGVLCARGQARLQNTHDPYRLMLPLMREAGAAGGTRGDGRWSTLDADAALAFVREAVALPESGSNRLVVAVDPRQQDREPVLGAFAKATASGDVHLGHPAPWLADASTAILETPGWILVPRWERARGALIWGADPVASGLDQVADSRAIEQLRDDMPIVVVDPRLSETAAKADLWLPVRPGGDVALAWLLFRAWHEAGLFEGPDDWMRSVMVRPVPYLEQRCGLGIEIIREAADLLAEAGSGLALRVGGGVGDRPGAADVTEAILRLAALAGATALGGAMQPTLAPHHVVGKRPIEALSTLLLDGGSIDTLVVVGDGGIVDSPRHSQLLAALADRERVGQLIVLATTMNPVAALADVILPDVTEHERSGLVTRWDGTSMVAPVVASPLEHGHLPRELQRGFEGVIEVIAEARGSSLDSAAALTAALEETGAADELRERGWIPPALPTAPPPLAQAFREDASRSPGRPIPGLALATYREPFGGFVDSLAQYWSTPSLRRKNEAWVHVETHAGMVEAAAREAGEHEDGEHSGDGHKKAGGGHGAREAPWVELEGGGPVQKCVVRLTPAVRPGVVAFAIGYGHTAGFDGEMWVDGLAVQRDPRRCIGVDVGALTSAEGDLFMTPLANVKKPGLLERLRPPEMTCAQL